MFFHKTFTFSKQQLGILAILIGVIGLAGIFFYDRLGFSNPDAGFGPSQKLGLLAAGSIIFIGLTLLPLGDDPA